MPPHATAAACQQQLPRVVRVDRCYTCARPLAGYARTHDEPQPVRSGPCTKVDYVLADSGVASDALRPGPTQSWESIAGAHLHRLVCCALALEPTSLVPAQRVGSTRPRLHLPPYGDPAWSAVS